MMGMTPLALPSPGVGGLSTTSSSPDPDRPRAQLSRRAKAAIVVRFLINDGADLALEDLPEDLQSILTHQMAKMRLVDRHTVEEVIEEFADELEAVGLSFPGGMAGALQALDGRLSPHTAARLRKEAGVRQTGNPWERILSMPPEKLQPIFETESPEICAVVLSKLEVSAAATLIGLLPGPKARQITYAVSQTTAVTPETVDRIGLSLASQLDAMPSSAFKVGPVKRVGEILNNTTQATREDMLTGLDETDKEFASEVRKAIFTFENIPDRVATRDVPTILRGIDQGQLTIAMGAAKTAGFEKVSDFIFGNMSKRLAEQMQDDIAELGDISQADGEAAMSDLVAVIRQMETDGELALLPPPSGDDEDGQITINTAP